MFDIAFASSAGNADVFASVGADGSVRMFDLRNLEHSTIIYETSDEKPLLRLAWNKQDPNYLATFQMDDMKVIILDIRLPSVPAAELTGHTACLNSLAWAPHSSTHICTAADDKNALIWDIGRKPVTGTPSVPTPSLHSSPLGRVAPILPTANRLVTTPFHSSYPSRPPLVTRL